jgi:hypothetical protein
VHAMAGKAGRGTLFERFGFDWPDERRKHQSSN